MTKEKIIQKIQTIIKDYGSFSANEVGQDAPVLKTMGENHSELIEQFNLDDVDTVQYVHEIEVNEDSIEYEDLPENVLKEILFIAEVYKVDMDKTMDKSRDENF
jgi:hypothetical protein